MQSGKVHSYQPTPFWVPPGLSSPWLWFARLQIFFLLETANRLPSVTGLDTAEAVCAFQTFTWLPLWIYFLAIDLRSDYILERIGPAFEIEMETSISGAEDTEEPVEYDTRLWSGGCKQSPRVWVLKNLPLITAMGQSKRTKHRCLSEASVCASQTL